MDRRRPSAACSSPVMEMVPNASRLSITMLPSRSPTVTSAGMGAGVGGLAGGRLRRTAPCVVPEDLDAVCGGDFDDERD